MRNAIRPYLSGDDYDNDDDDDDDNENDKASRTDDNMTKWYNEICIISLKNSL